MTSPYDFHLPNFIFEIICLIIFPKFLSFVYITSKLSILFNHAKYFIKLASYYILSLFTILKSLYPTDQPACLKEDDFSFARKRLSCTKKSGL